MSRAVGPAEGNSALGWLLAGLVVALFIGANAHLLYVATTSQPTCVDHFIRGDENAKAHVLSAAESSCSTK